MFIGIIFKLYQILLCLCVHLYYFQVVLITGASSGLGEALAHALHKCGVRLILAARNTEKLENIKETLLKTYKVSQL